MQVPFTWSEMDDLLRRALEEDVGSGDVTTEAVVDPDARAVMEWVARSPLVVCGLFAGARVFELVANSVEVVGHSVEGERAETGDLIMQLRGPARALLTGERTALNVVQHASGVATLTSKFVEAVSGTNAKIAATRKTMPFMRRLVKYAVFVAGGVPHRFGLDDGVLIKDNHIALAGSIGEAVSRAKKAHHLLKIEVEVSDLEQAEEAYAAGADALLLDNMDAAQMSRVVEKYKGRALLEASGNVTLENVAHVAMTGVDIISVGALTHSTPAADISARMRPAGN
jgi:nicotinate-nucleotide pyrophosphorylase (carboxylating)